MEKMQRPVSNLPVGVVATAQQFLDQKNVEAAWRTLAAAGDTYADNAAAVVGNPKSGGDLFFHQLVKDYWGNTVGADVYNQKIQEVASRHLSNYLKILVNQELPTSQDILDSYSQALDLSGVSRSAAFDGAWVKAVEGTDGKYLGAENWWAGMLGMPLGRITTSNTDSTMTPQEARQALLLTGRDTIQHLVDQKGLIGATEAIKQAIRSGIADQRSNLGHYLRDDILIPLGKELLGDLEELTDNLPEGEVRRAAKNILDEVRSLVGQAQNMCSPIILDLDGDGVETVAVRTGIYFDHDGNRFAEATGWVGRDDGLLVRDRNGNGQIDDGSELFGSYSPLANGARANDGFQALAQFDLNGDRKVDLNEATIAHLQVWKDANQNGHVEQGEMLSLEKAGVRSLGLAASYSSLTDAQGNAHTLLGTYLAADGKSRAMEDIWFAVDLARTANKDLRVVSADIAALPDIAGLGNVPSLHQAMARDGSGHLRGLVEQYMGQSNAAARSAIATQIIYAWTGVEQTDPNLRAGILIPGSWLGDYRKLTSLEALLGTYYVNVYSGSSAPSIPLEYASKILQQAFDKLLGYVQKQLDRGIAAELINHIGLVWNQDSGSFEMNFAPVVNILQTRFATDKTAALHALEVLSEDIASLSGSARYYEQLRQMGNLEGNVLEMRLAALGYPNAIVGTDGADRIGPASDSTMKESFIFGGAGNDVINGGVYSDNTINAGSGDDTITDSGGDDSIDGGTGDDVIVDQGYGVNVLRGGTGNDTITFSGYANNTIDGGDGDDVIKSTGGYYSGQYKNVISGGRGNDRIESGSSRDTYYFNRGDGQDSIRNVDIYTGSSDKIIFGAGIGKDDLFVERLGNHLVVQINDASNRSSTDQITVESWYGNSRSQIELFEFADGSTLTAAQLTALGNIIYGTEAGETIDGFAENNTIYGFAGGDTISDSYGNDMIDGGAGNDTITDSSGDDIIDGGTGDDVIVDQGYGVNVLRGGTGNDTITFSGYANNTIDGGDGDDVIKSNVSYYSSQYKNVISGGRGNDRIESGASSDTYCFNRGDGQDRILDVGNGSSYAADQIVFGDDISADQLWLRHVGRDLEIGVIGTAETITVENWYVSSAYRVEQLKCSNGSSLIDQQIEMLVQAMASFAPPTLGQTSLPQQYREVLAPALATSWR